MHRKLEDCFRDQTERSLAVHQAAIVIDTHADTTQRMLDEGTIWQTRSKAAMSISSPAQGQPGSGVLSIWWTRLLTEWT